MRDCLGPGTVAGYCTNVHAGRTLTEIKHNLDTHTRAVKMQVCPDRPLGIGLWLPASVARTLCHEQQAPALRDWLTERGLFVYTLNGFPHGDFHAPVVKHAVYAPDWADARRAAYTRDLVDILATLLPGGLEGSISTLPIGWRSPAPDWPAAVQQLVDAAERLRRLEAETGVLIHLDIEPEPGCCLDQSGDVVALFKQRLLPAGEEATLRRHLRVCHDICHAAVMFEPQAAALGNYVAAGIAVGKIQVSACPVARFDDAARADVRRALDELVEPRFLHQTVVQHDAACRLYDDLPDALATAPSAGEWRVHFHVPIFATRLGPLATTQADIAACLRALPAGTVRHFEVETYAWNVLPPAYRDADLAAGIARELNWLIDTAGRSAAP